MVQEFDELRIDLNQVGHVGDDLNGNLENHVFIKSHQFRLILFYRISLNIYWDFHGLIRLG